MKRIPHETPKQSERATLAVQELPNANCAVSATRPAMSARPIPAADPLTAASNVRPHLLTVATEDYFQVAAFNRFITREQWYRFETRIFYTTTKTLALLKRFDIKATFFMLGWVAQRWPELAREIAEQGHELANNGYYHRGLKEMSREEFRDDLLRSQEAIERATGTRVRGFRLSDGWLKATDLWVLDVLHEEGYAYDSSLLPLLGRFRQQPWRRFVHEHETPTGKIWECPPSAISVCGLNIPIAGGNYLRQFPESFVRRAIRRWDQDCPAPFVMYFHVWELDPLQPRISAAGWLTRLRHYRNLGKFQRLLEEYFSAYSFQSVADYLELDLQLPEGRMSALPAGRDSIERLRSEPSHANGAKTVATNISIVIPCYNEERVLPYLGNTLQSVEDHLGDGFKAHVILVDDCSRDDTETVLQQVYGNRPNYTIIRHAENVGVMGAIQTGIRAANTDIVCSMDCDCSYDPHELRNMIPLLTEDVDMVTASPYHAEGRVRNVPRWRLFLSKNLSWLYSLVVPQKLATYTSCFRVYRKNAVAGIELDDTGFLGVAELAGRLSLNGSTIVEYPTTLDVRIFGESKMKILRTILGHLSLLRRLGAIRRQQKRMNSRLKSTHVGS